MRTCWCGTSFHTRALCIRLGSALSLTVVVVTVLVVVVVVLVVVVVVVVSVVVVDVVVVVVVVVTAMHVPLPLHSPGPLLMLQLAPCGRAVPVKHAFSKHSAVSHVCGQSEASTHCCARAADARSTHSRAHVNNDGTRGMPLVRRVRARPWAQPQHGERTVRTRAGEGKEVSGGQASEKKLGGVDLLPLLAAERECV